MMHKRLGWRWAGAALVGAVLLLGGGVRGQAAQGQGLQTQGQGLQTQVQAQATQAEQAQAGLAQAAQAMGQPQTLAAAAHAAQAGALTTGGEATEAVRMAAVRHAGVPGGERSYNFGFRKSRGGQLPSIAREGFMDMLKRHGAVFLGDTAQKELYLTFDNGYENGFTAKVLDTLRDKKVPAAFFVTGHFILSEPELVKRMVNEGHIVGNHSWHHPDLSVSSDARIVEELDKVKAAVAELTGQKEMKYLRPPRGVFSDRLLAAAGRQGYTSVFWSVAYKDWEVNNQKGPQHAYDSVMAQLHPGAVVLLHSVSSDNAGALGRIIDDARKEGYAFKSLDELQTKVYR